jgi:Flp pilus assembly protein TadD
VSQTDTDVRYTLALALLSRAGQQTRRSDIDEAIQHLQRVVTDRPTFAEAHYNLGVAVFMSGRPADALPHIRESIRLNPNDPQANAFLEVLQREIITH